MATQRIDLLDGSVKLDNSGKVYAKPASFDDANDRFDHMVLAFKDSGTKVSISGRFNVPKNWTNGAGSRIGARWRTNATSGDVVFDVEYKAVAVGESFDPSTDDEALTVTDTAAGTARLANDAVVDLDESLLAVDDSVLWKFSRDGADAADTLASEVVLEALWFEYIA